MRIAVAACLCFGTVSAQEQLRVRPAEVQQEDVVAALGALGVDMLRFDFSDFTRENYDVAVYLDEADSTGTERLYTVRAGGTRQQLTRMPEEVRRGFGKELHLPETTTEYVRGRSLTLIFSQKNDSTKLLTVHIPGMMRFSLPLELRDSGAGGEPRYFYSGRASSRRSKPEAKRFRWRFTVRAGTIRRRVSCAVAAFPKSIPR